MAIDAQDPVDLRRDFLCEIKQRGCELRHFRLPFRIEFIAAGREEHFGLEDKSVADDADVFTIGQNFAQPPEEVGPIAVQFLHPLRQRDIEAAAEIGDLDLRRGILGFRSLQRGFDRGNLRPQRRNLLVEQLDLRGGAGIGLPLLVQFTGETADTGVGAGIVAGASVEQCLQPRPFILRRGKGGLQARQGVLHILLVALFHGQKFGQFGNLAVETRQHLVLAGNLTRQHELREHEDRQQKHDGHQQRRQRIDEARPIIHTPVAAAVARKRHGYSLPLSCRVRPEDFVSLSIRAESRSSVRRSDLDSSCCASIQSRNICCSLRMFLTRP